MTSAVMAAPSGVRGLVSPRGRLLPVLTVIAVIVALWYLLAVALNYTRVSEQLAGIDPEYSTLDVIKGTWRMERPVLPAPDQIATDLWNSTIGLKVTSKRSLVYHAGVTASATLLGFLFGTILGIVLAAGIVHVRTLDRSLMPWIIASQTVPILAIAPMVIVVLGNVGITGLIPKALISAYLCFFPVTIGMVKGLRSPDPLQMDLMRTYSASRLQVFWKLRVPASVPFLFASLKVAIAISLVGAIVGELPVGGAGLGARLLSGSYYGQMVQIWSALFMAAFLGMALVYAIAGVEWATLRRAGARA